MKGDLLQSAIIAYPTPAHPCAQRIRPPWKAEVPIMQEQLSARTSCPLKNCSCIFDAPYILGGHKKALSEQLTGLF
ncbi:MAG: hypothetical protein ACJAUP_001964 [Cellvibrionaceae bacterium]|jgi:hypothetical protein